MQVFPVISPALTGGFFTTCMTWEALMCLDSFIDLSVDFRYVCVYVFIHSFIHFLSQAAIQSFSKYLLSFYLVLSAILGPEKLGKIEGRRRRG